MDLTTLNLSEEQLTAVQKAIQSEADKVRTEYSAKLKGVNEELSKYKPKEKSQAELDIEERLAALETKEKELASKEKDVKVRSKLKEMGLPEGLADYLKINEEQDVEKVGGEIANYFLENGSKPGSHPKSQLVTREQFSRMSYSQRAQLYKDNPELYKVLSK